jgi:predicted dehydrogenase
MCRRLRVDTAVTLETNPCFIGVSTVAKKRIGKALATPTSGRHNTTDMTARILALIFVTTVFTATADDVRIGMIGLDTSHVVEFTRRLNDPKNKNHVEGGKVVAAFKGGSEDMTTESMRRIPAYAKELETKWGVKPYDSIDALVKDVDVVMVESVDGRKHLEQALPAIKAGKRVFIDKPVSGSLRDAIKIYDFAKQHNVPIYSGSSLRYYPNLQEMKRTDVGELKGAYSTGPAHMEKHHPDLFWYGIHPTEALYTIMGTGCESVVCTFTPDTHVATGVWKDGKVGTLRGIRNAIEPYRVSVYGTKKVLDQQLAGDYTPFLREVIKFLQTGIAPVSPEETIEIYAFMEAVDESKREGGKPVRIADVMAKNKP